MQVDPMNPTLKAPGTKRLKLKNDELLSNFAFKFNLRRYMSTKLKRIILKAAYYVVLAIVKAVLAVPRVLLKIANAVLLVVEIALKVARFALNAAMCVVLAFVGAWDKILDKVGSGGYFHEPGPSQVSIPLQDPSVKSAIHATKSAQIRPNPLQCCQTPPVSE